MSVQIDLSDDVAVVTGGGSGIGEGIATMLVQAGAKVAILDMSGTAAVFDLEGVLVGALPESAAVTDAGPTGLGDLRSTCSSRQSESASGPDTP